MRKSPAGSGNSCKIKTSKLMQTQGVEPGMATSSLYYRHIQACAPCTMSAFSSPFCPFLHTNIFDSFPKKVSTNTALCGLGFNLKHQNHVLQLCTMHHIRFLFSFLCFSLCEGKIETVSKRLENPLVMRRRELNVNIEPCQLLQFSI
jgi:hypothetical protein